MPSVRLSGRPVGVGVLPGLLAGGEHPVGDHVHRGVEVELLPLGAVRAPVAAPSAAARSLVTRLLLAEPLGQSRPREIGLSGSPSIWMTLPSLTKTRWPQPTAQYGQTERATESAVSVRAVSAADRGGLRRRAPAQRVGAGQLPVDRPALDPGADAHTQTLDQAAPLSTFSSAVATVRASPAVIREVKCRSMAAR